MIIMLNDTGLPILLHMGDDHKRVFFEQQLAALWVAEKDEKGEAFCTYINRGGRLLTSIKTLLTAVLLPTRLR